MSPPFFYLHCDDGPGGVAYAPQSIVSDRLLDYQHVKECPFALTLRDGPAEDFLATDIGWRLFSPAAKSTLRLGKAPQMCWLRVNIETGADNTTPYFAPIFIEEVDVISKEESLLVDDGLIVKAVLDAHKVNGLEFFPLGRDGFRLVVSRRLKDRLEQTRMTGFDYSPLPMRRSLYGKSYH